jgi:hypothetical protein
VARINQVPFCGCSRKNYGKKKYTASGRQKRRFCRSSEESNRKRKEKHPKRKDKQYKKVCVFPLHITF